MFKDYGFALDFKINEGNAPSYEDPRNLFVIENDESIPFKFEIDPNLINDVDKIADFFFECSNSLNDDYLIKSFEEVVNNLKEEKSKGFWISRIFANLFLYDMSNNGFNHIQAFIDDSFYKLNKDLESKIPDYNPPYSFNLSLAAIKIINYEDNLARIETISAGNSSIFVLIKEGLRRVNINLNRNNRVRIYYNNYESINHLNPSFELSREIFNFDEPTIVFVCSNSLFENLINFDFENILLSSLMYSKDFDDFKNNTYKLLKDKVTKDASLSLTALLFNNFDEIKEYFKPRYEYIKKLNMMYLKYEDKINIKNKKYYHDLKHSKYLIDEFKFYSSQIEKTISKNFKDKDIQELISKSLKREIKNNQIFIRSQEIEKELENKYKTSFTSYFKKHILDYSFYRKLNTDVISSKSKLFNILITTKMQIESEYRNKELEKKMIRYYYETVKELKDKINNIFIENELDNKQPLLKDLKEKNINLDIILLDDNNFHYLRTLFKEITEILKDSSYYKKLCKDLEIYVFEVKKYKESKRMINKYFDNLIIIFYTLLNDFKYEDLFNEFNINNEFKQLLNLYYEILPLKRFLNDIALNLSLKEYFKDEDNIKEFIYQRLKFGNKRTLIDEYFDELTLWGTISNYGYYRKDIEWLFNEIDKYNNNFYIITNKKYFNY